ncbi:mucin-5AC-like [Anarrhichthys ocellatus]|uniref:mucin-5AC-like n=1 Tax=Anarrhichthys ocellatus TaxID=433405 RepID=UPI0012ED60DC|nr:mucin-5AC-like [Anarrhichthys ocellatus]
MALSQLQCLDDNHVNPRTHESKPEFLYCENQRLALEAFLRDGREEFVKYLGAHSLRGFLSDPELETLAEAVEPYDPGSELFFPENAEEDEPPLSLHYWPELSDTSVPQMDLCWLDNISYRGVTRTSVYTQPPLEGQVHIKEVVRKMIAQAQKVIAVVMDVFTDVDIFRDLLDAGFKRKVSVYILLERTTLPHFQSMCQRANMHAGHLKNLRVRCTDGAEFYTRSCTKVRGQMGHRFMFIDGDKAVSGSYSFTWTSSRLDKNLITVVTGQAVEAFDRLFCVLYATSSSVDLRQVATETEPEVEPLPQPAPVTTSADMARKLYSPKYAMLGLANPSPTPTAGPKETENPQNSKNPETKKGRQKRASKEAIQDPPIHPGLTNLEKACMMSYLPTWPEPDPPSDVIGFINIRDTRKPNQVHQRSEMFETSQAVRFSSPFSMPKESLPDVAKPRQVTAKHETNKLQPAQDETKTEESVVDGAQPPQLNAVPADVKSKAEATRQKSPASGPKSDSDTTKTLNTENKQHSNTPTEQDARTPRQPSSKARTPNTGSPSHSTRPLPGSYADREAETNSNTQRDVSYSTQAPHLRPPTDSDTEPHAQTKTVPLCTDSQAVNAQPRNSCEITPYAESPTANSHTSSSSTSVSSSSFSENSHVSTATSRTIGSSSPLSSSSIPPLTFSSTTPNPPLPSSSAAPSSTSTPPVPKPRTVQLVFKGASDGQKLPEFSVVRKPETSTGLIHDEPAVAAVVQTSPENVPEIVPELQSDSRGKPEAQQDDDNTLDAGEAPQHKQSGTSRETRTKEADGRHERAAMQLAAGNKAKSDVLITDAPKAERVNTQEIIPTDVEPKTLMSTDCQITRQIECEATVRTEIKAPERSEVPNEKSESYSELSPKDVDVSEIVDSLKAPTYTVFATHTSKHSTDTESPHGNLSFTPARVTDSVPKAAKYNTHGTFQEQIPKAQASRHTPARPLHLHLSDTHVPDFRSATPERESRSLSALLRTPTPEGFLPRTPTPDGFLPRTPTPDSRTHTPDSRTHTPDPRSPNFQTPTSDGFISPRTNSALSTASEEYYECNDSPFHEPVFDRAAFRNHGTTDDHVSFTHANTPNATTITWAATSHIADRSTSISETESLSGPASASSSASLKKKMEEENFENGREEDERGERRTEGDYQATDRRGSEDAKRTADHFKHFKHSEEENEAQALKRKRVISQSAAGRPVDAGVTPTELTNERTEPQRFSAGDRQLRKSSSERKRLNMEKAADRAALGPSGAERRDRPPSTGDTDGQKLLHTPLKTPRGQQRDIRAPSPSRQSRPPQPLSINRALGPRIWGSRHLNQVESKVLPGSVQSADNTSSPRRQPSRPPPRVTAGADWLAAGREYDEVSRQPPAAQSRTRAGPTPNQHPPPKPEASQSQTVSPQEEEKAPFSFTFSKLYSLKVLKEMSKPPSQRKTDSNSSHVQGRKSSS